MVKDMVAEEEEEAAGEGGLPLVFQACGRIVEILTIPTFFESLTTSKLVPN
jgi:hypothetical protein